MKTSSRPSPTTYIHPLYVRLSSGENHPLVYSTLRAFEVISPMSPLKTVIVKILLTPTSKHFCCQMYLHTLFVRDSSSILPVTFLPNNFFVLWLGRLVSFTLLSFLRPCPSYMIQCPPVSVCAGSHAPFLFLM